MACLGDCRCCDGCGGGSVNNTQLQQYKNYVNNLSPTDIMNMGDIYGTEDPYSISVDVWDTPLDETPVEVAQEKSAFPWWIVIVAGMIMLTGKAD